MSLQNYFGRYHKNIKVDTEELRDKRDILVSKIRDSLKEKGHPLPEALNQGSYIYGVGVKPSKDEEYDIDVGLDFPILSSDYDAKIVRGWVYEAIKDHTDKVEDRGPCIRVRYAKGYHVDLVIYARHKDSDEVEEYQLAFKSGEWKPAEPKVLKKYISDARTAFKDTKDSSGSDQLQRVTRDLKRWNDIVLDSDSPDKPSGLATLLLVIEALKYPFVDADGESRDIDALIKIADYAVAMKPQISIKKPTPQYEDMYGKISEKGMKDIITRFENLSKNLKLAKSSEEEKAVEILKGEFGDDFPSFLKKSDSSEDGRASVLVADMGAAIPTYKSPARPHGC